MAVEGESGPDPAVCIAMLLSRERSFIRGADAVTEAEGSKAGEITPAYAILPVEVIREIRREFPDIRLIYLIRNPMDRAWSSARRGGRCDRTACGGPVWNVMCGPISNSVKAPTCAAAVEPTICAFHRPHSRVPSAPQEVNHVASVSKSTGAVGGEGGYAMAGAAPSTAIQPTGTASGACKR